MLTQADHHTDMQKTPIPEIKEPIDDVYPKSPTKTNQTNSSPTKVIPDEQSSINTKNLSNNVIVKARSDKVKAEVKVSNDKSGNA